MTNPVRMERPVNSTFNILAPDSVRVPGFAIPGPLTPPPNPDYRSGWRCCPICCAGTRASPRASTTMGCGWPGRWGPANPVWWWKSPPG